MEVPLNFFDRLPRPKHSQFVVLVRFYIKLLFPQAVQNFQDQNNWFEPSLSIITSEGFKKDSAGHPEAELERLQVIGRILFFCIGCGWLFSAFFSLFWNWFERIVRDK